jgi:hypothetical protein
MSRAQLTSTVEQSSGGVVAPFLAGKNKIINGDFNIWQRGTSFSLPSSFSYTYTADRFNCFSTSAGTTVSRQTFTPGSAPVAGYEGKYFLRYYTSDTSVGHILRHQIEDVQTFAGQTITISFWAKAASSLAFSGYMTCVQDFGSGGSSQVSTGQISMSPSSITTSWQRFVGTVAIPSIAGKTVGTSSFLTVQIGAAGNNTLDVFGFQAEAGSVATPFTTASNTLQGELALCMRYYQRWVDGNGNTGVGTGVVVSASRVNDINFRFIVPMRTYPAFSYTGTIAVYDGFSTNVTSVAASSIGALGMYFDANCANSGLTTGRAAGATVSAGTGNYLEFSAEL